MHMVKLTEGIIQDKCPGAVGRDVKVRILKPNVSEWAWRPDDYISETEKERQGRLGMGVSFRRHIDDPIVSDVSLDTKELLLSNLLGAIDDYKVWWDTWRVFEASQRRAVHDWLRKRAREDAELNFDALVQLPFVDKISWSTASGILCGFQSLMCTAIAVDLRPRRKDRKRLRYLRP